MWSHKNDASHTIWFKFIYKILHKKKVTKKLFLSSTTKDENSYKSHKIIRGKNQFLISTKAKKEIELDKLELKFNQNWCCRHWKGQDPWMQHIHIIQRNSFLSIYNMDEEVKPKRRKSTCIVWNISENQKVLIKLFGLTIERERCFRISEKHMNWIENWIELDWKCIFKEKVSILQLNSKWNAKKIL